MAKPKSDLKRTDASQAIYQIKVTLLGSEPPIWRRLLVPLDMTLAHLHHVVQAAMGWHDDHMHEFLIGRRRFGAPEPRDSFMGGPACINEAKVGIAEVLTRVGSKAEYTYDFGDSWEHVIKVEKVLTAAAGVIYPLCTDGKSNAPPEDCGGIGGFYNMLEAISDPNHPEHEDIKDWMGADFDPESFSLDAVNQRLRKRFPPARKNRQT